MPHTVPLATLLTLLVALALPGCAAKGRPARTAGAASGQPALIPIPATVERRDAPSFTR